MQSNAHTLGNSNTQFNYYSTNGHFYSFIVSFTVTVTVEGTTCTVAVQVRSNY